MRRPATSYDATYGATPTDPPALPLLALVVLGLALLVVVAVTTPWNPLGARPPGGGTPVDPGTDFTAAMLAREDAFHAALRPWSLSALAVGVLVPVVLALTPLGARLVTALARPLGGGWVWQVLLGVLGLTLLGRLASLPLSARAEVVLRRYGLSTQTWGSWLTDVAKSWAISTGLLLVVALVFYAVARATPHWWVWLSGAAAVLVIVISFAYPVVVEPLFNKFQPMPAGQLRDSLIAMARTDGVPVRDVLVADASRRTTTHNAYVSGFGATRRIVVYDTLLSGAPPEQVRLVVAHELGHAKANDVLHGTLVGALAAAAAVPLLALVLGSGPLLRRAGATGAADPRSLALLLAAVAVVSLLTQPGQMLVSRHIEARADVHALDLTRDPDTFVRMQRELAVANLSDLDPPAPIYVWFGSHPTGPARIAMARDWALVHRQAVPPPLAAAASTP